MFRTRSLVAGAALATVLASLGIPSGASAAPAASPRLVHKVGTGSYRVTGTGSGLPASLATEIRRDAEPDEGFAATAAAPAGAHRSLAPARRAPSARKGAAAGAAGTVHTNPRLLRSFDG